MSVRLITFPLMLAFVTCLVGGTASSRSEASAEPTCNDSDEHILVRDSWEEDQYRTIGFCIADTLESPALLIMRIPRKGQPDVSVLFFDYPDDAMVIVIWLNRLTERFNRQSFDSLPMLSV
jgi:hypothetical protein